MMRVMRTSDSKENLCDTCLRSKEIPLCFPDGLEFGDGTGNDNIVACCNYLWNNNPNTTVYVGEIANHSKEVSE